MISEWWRTRSPQNEIIAEKLAQANLKVAELEVKLADLQQELIVLQTQDKRMPIVRDDPYDFLGSES